MSLGAKNFFICPAMQNGLLTLPKNIKIVYLLDNIYIRFSSKPYTQNIGIQMGTTCNCAPLVDDLFLFLLRERLHRKTV